MQLSSDTQLGLLLLRGEAACVAACAQAEARSRFLEQRVADLTVTATQLQARVVELEQEVCVCAHS